MKIHKVLSDEERGRLFIKSIILKWFESEEFGEIGTELGFEIGLGLRDLGLALDPGRVNQFIYETLQIVLDEFKNITPDALDSDLVS